MIPETATSGAERSGISVLVPTYERHEVLIETLEALLRLRPAPDEVVVVDQSRSHPREVEDRLSSLEATGAIRRLRRLEPSIPGAMNDALLAARFEFVLFTDDDVVPSAELISAHLEALRHAPPGIVAGQVLQPGEEPEALAGESFSFRSSVPQVVEEFIGCNFSAPRGLLLQLGGFDESFVAAAYRYERELSDRARRSGYAISFEPRASLRHLRAQGGGTRAWGDHLRTVRPSHSVGEYYYLLRARRRPRRFVEILRRPVLAVWTRHHLTHPWWLPVTLLAEVAGFVWGVALAIRPQKLLTSRVKPVRSA